MTPAIKMFDLRAPDSGPLPAARAGAHVELSLPGQILRQYSLVNAQADLDRYLIVVAREEHGRGGSAFLHDQVQAGDKIAVSRPRNHFALAEHDAPAVLIAGGIGVTPLWSMLRQLLAAGRAFEFHYAARHWHSAAFGEDLEALAAEGHKAHLYYSRDADGRRLDVAEAVWAAPPDSHFYVCGPRNLLDAFRAAAADIPSERLHWEQFAAAEPPARAGGFKVELARAGVSLEILAGQTILDALQQAGIAAAYSCRNGVCGQCETRVLAGKPDHRDAVLGEAERAAGKSMMICCSGAFGDRLVLDL